MYDDNVHIMMKHNKIQTGLITKKKSSHWDGHGSSAPQESGLAEIAGALVVRQATEVVAPHWDSYTSADEVRFQAVSCGFRCYYNK